ncbi:hypothetical protein L0U88_11495 [Flavihumibacter sp. RY-1]|uniref:Uncharacterized protein n=1 Tax=Flavihumibacter fluminis TaxID=2909236 RepID=A0ABS9BHR9_9BACT|nr:hypothetical protein [Flavihumibacter fluminis]MCF1715251.1 hypothetical protein [Flavihumibacter fluminis]
MKQFFYLNLVPQIDGYREVHTSDCRFFPTQHNRIPLGEYFSCREAVAAAKNKYLKSDGCYYCCRECHTR